jgi:hypothetical protein
LAIVIFSRPVAFPIAILRQQLAQDLPALRWQVGEAESGAPGMVSSYGPREFISGRNDDTMVLVELRFHDAALPGGPPHGCHLVLTNQGADEPKLAQKVMLSILQGLMRNDAHLARCQLYPAGNWLDTADLARAVRFIESGEAIELADGLGIPHEETVQADAGAAVGAALAHVPDLVMTPGALASGLVKRGFGPRRQPATFGRRQS